MLINWIHSLVANMMDIISTSKHQNALPCEVLRSVSNPCLHWITCRKHSCRCEQKQLRHARWDSYHFPFSLLAKKSIFLTPSHTCFNFVWDLITTPPSLHRGLRVVSLVKWLSTLGSDGQAVLEYLCAENLEECVEERFFLNSVVSFFSQLWMRTLQLHEYVTTMSVKTANTNKS